MSYSQKIADLLDNPNINKLLKRIRNKDIRYMTFKVSDHSIFFSFSNGQKMTIKGERFMMEILLTLFPDFSQFKSTSWNILNDFKSFITNTPIAYDVYEMSLGTASQNTFIVSSYDPDNVMINMRQKYKHGRIEDVYYVGKLDSNDRDVFQVVNVNKPSLSL